MIACVFFIGIVLYERRASLDFTKTFHFYRSKISKFSILLLSFFLETFFFYQTYKISTIIKTCSIYHKTFLLNIFLALLRHIAVEQSTNIKPKLLLLTLCLTLPARCSTPFL